MSDTVDWKAKCLDRAGDAIDDGMLVLEHAGNPNQIAQQPLPAFGMLRQERLDDHSTSDTAGG
jgi:hypothetical protein